MQSFLPMIVYQATKGEFVRQATLNQIVEEIEKAFIERMGHSTSVNEIRSWQNSMQYMANVLSADIQDGRQIPDNAGVAIEFKIPNTSKRVDFIISGKDEHHKNTAVIVELKQWESAEITDKDAMVRTYVAGALRDETHPSYQAWSYATLIEDFNQSVQDQDIKLHPCAYLHNYKEATPPVILSDSYRECLSQAPAFIKNDVLKLKEFIHKYIKYGDDKETLYLIDNGKIHPSKSLQDALVGMLEGNREFIMIDEQKNVYETAIKLARRSYKDGNKRVLIVKGGPGTGKSVLAVQLLVNLIKEGMNCLYVTKNSAPRNIYSAKLTGKRFSIPRVKNLFKGSGSFVDSRENEFDVLITDEAHRLNAKSGMFSNLGENQVKEIINAAKFSIFFIDESQRVTLSDIGSIAEIQKFARAANARGTIMELESQFRCDGSDGYISWVDDVLEIRETANKEGFDLDYDIRVFDSPNEVRDIIYEKNLEKNKARLLSGYCWDWIQNGKNRSDVFDITIPEYNFAMSWNLGNTATWAIDPDSVNEIGCIHTSQGLEFEYVGVIIGDDLRYENGRIVTDYTKRASTDKSLFGIKAMYRRNPEGALDAADEIIKNTYRTLMTRGMKGCYIYCTNKPLAEYLKERIKNIKKN